MTGCRVSIVIPVYNVEKYLGECLDSVLGQTLKDIEVLCVDDGSTDSSPRILAAYAAKDPRVKVLRQKNAGPGPARNRALDSAAGEAVVFMDPDDKYPDDGVLSDLWTALSHSDCPVAGGKARCFPEDDPAVAWRNAVSDRVCAFPRFGQVEYREYQVPYRYWCFMFKRELLDGIRFPSLQSFQDVPFFATVMAKAGRFVAVNRLVYCYRQHEGNGTRNLSDAKKADRLAGMRMVIDVAVRNRYWRMFDNMRRSFCANGRKFGYGMIRLLSIVGMRNEIIYRFRKLFGLVYGGISPIKREDHPEERGT